MQTIKPLWEQLAEIGSKLIFAASQNKKVVAIEMPSDLFAYMVSTLPENMQVPDGIFENSKLLPGKAQFLFENEFVKQEVQ